MSSWSDKPSYEWKKQEKRVAQRRGGKQNPGSGSGWRKPNDVRETKVLWEMKQTGAKQITVKLSDWDKVRSNALLTGRMPAMHLQLGEGRSARRLVVISEDDFDELMPVLQQDMANRIHQLEQELAALIALT